MNLGWIADLIGNDAFQRLVKSVPETRARRTFWVWQEELLERLRVQLGYEIQSCDDFEKVFGIVYDDQRSQQIERIRTLMSQAGKAFNDFDEAVAATFGETDRATATTILNKYVGEERVRVQTALLVLSAGRIDQLERYAKMANDDYRDLLMNAEYSNSVDVAEQYLVSALRLPPNLRKVVEEICNSKN